MPTSQITSEIVAEEERIPLALDMLDIAASMAVSREMISASAVLSLALDLRQLLSEGSMPAAVDL